MKTEKELRKRLNDLEVGVRLIENGDVQLYANKISKIRMLKEIEFLKGVLEIK